MTLPLIHWHIISIQTSIHFSPYIFPPTLPSHFHSIADSFGSAMRSSRYPMSLRWLDLLWISLGSRASSMAGSTVSTWCDQQWDRQQMSSLGLVDWWIGGNGDGSECRCGSLIGWRSATIPRRLDGGYIGGICCGVVGDQVRAPSLVYGYTLSGDCGDCCPWYLPFPMIGKKASTGHSDLDHGAVTKVRSRLGGC